MTPKLHTNAQKLTTKLYGPKGTSIDRLRAMGEGKWWVKREKASTTRKAVGAIALGVRRAAESQMRRLFVADLIKHLESQKCVMNLDFAQACAEYAGVSIRRQSMSKYFAHLPRMSDIHPALNEQKELIGAAEVAIVEAWKDSNYQAFCSHINKIQARHREVWREVKPLIDKLIEQMFQGYAEDDAQTDPAD